MELLFWAIYLEASVNTAGPQSFVTSLVRVIE